MSRTRMQVWTKLMARSLSFYSPAVVDFDAYRGRIGQRGHPSIAQLHRAHVISIPFENLDPQRGVSVSLAPEDLERKLVAERRGGYCFEHNLLVPEPVQFIDVEVSNWFASTHPRSPFVSGLVVSTQRDDGTLTSLSNWSGLALTEQTPAGKLVTPVAPEAVPELLEARFGLPGFTLGADGRFVPGSDR
jgi:arylamine N-acetyltransferase